MTLFRHTAAAALALALSCLQGTAHEFRVADNQVADYPTVRALVFMDQLVRARSGGAHGLRIFHSGQLGDEDATVAQTRAGVLDMNRVNVAPLAELVPELQIFNLPFLFRSSGHLRAVLDGPLGEQILASFEKSGMVGLAFFDSGARSFYNAVRPIRSVDDMKGLTIRVQPSALNEAFIRALGAVPSPLAYSHVVTALRTKLIDGAENNWPSYVTREHYKNAPYITSTAHTMVPEVLFMSNAAWTQLKADDKALLRSAAREAAQYMRIQWETYETAARSKALAEGVQVVETFERAPFERAVAPLQATLAANPRLRALIDEVRATGR